MPQGKKKAVDKLTGQRNALAHHWQNHQQNASNPNVILQ